MGKQKCADTRERSLVILSVLRVMGAHAPGRFTEGRKSSQWITVRGGRLTEESLLGSAMHHCSACTLHRCQRMGQTRVKILLELLFPSLGLCCRFFCPEEAPFFQFVCPKWVPFSNLCQAPKASSTLALISGFDLNIPLRHWPATNMRLLVTRSEPNTTTCGVPRFPSTSSQ